MLTKGGLTMSVVIIGGNECMECRYKKICKSYGCKAKIFTKENGPLKKKIGSPSFMILFTNTVSHQMARSALEEAKKNNIPVIRMHSSSTCALCSILDKHCS
jgi:hypothetical protein